MKEVIKEAIKLLENGTPGVLATVVRTKGSTPQKPGAMLLVREDGTVWELWEAAALKGTSGSLRKRCCVCTADPSLKTIS
jgi:xanthine/CO dehydrogenase XdhC/CoxF family maturation factor